MSCRRAGESGDTHAASPDGNLGDALVMRCGVQIRFEDLSEDDADATCPSCRESADFDDDDGAGYY
jgi:hypothetical protein